MSYGLHFVSPGIVKKLAFVPNNTTRIQYCRPQSVLLNCCAHLHLGKRFRVIVTVPSKPAIMGSPFIERCLKVSIRPVINCLTTRLAAASKNETALVHLHRTMCVSFSGYPSPDIFLPRCVYQARLSCTSVHLHQTTDVIVRTTANVHTYRHYNSSNMIHYSNAMWNLCQLLSRLLSVPFVVQLFVTKRNQ
jgi:hypothetical protein